MTLNEKALCRLLKQAYKSTGYKIIQKGDTTTIGIPGLVVILQKVPRKLLGLLVEHTGAIPENCSIQVMANMDNQTMLEGAALGLRTSLEEPARAARTPLEWAGYLAIYQCKGGQVFGVQKYHLELIDDADEAEPMVDLENQVAAWYGNGQEVFVYVQTNKENAHFTALESTKWTL